MLVSATAFASTPARQDLLKSQGVVRFTDSNGNYTSIDSSDLKTLANEIDTLESGVKNGIYNSLVKIGTTNASPSMEFGQLFTCIENSQNCHNTGAVARNLSLGKTAWVDGVYVTGNGGDVDEAYQRGYADGLAMIGNASVQYTYHQHTGTENACGGCYTVGYHVHTASCPKHQHNSDCAQHKSWHYTQSGHSPIFNQSWGAETTYSGHCPCGWSDSQVGVGWDHCPNGPGYYETIYDCGMTGKYTCNQANNKWGLGCGKQAGVTIESATIVFP